MDIKDLGIGAMIGSVLGYFLKVLDDWRTDRKQKQTTKDEQLAERSNKVINVRHDRYEPSRISLDGDYQEMGEQLIVNPYWITIAENVTILHNHSPSPQLYEHSRKGGPVMPLTQDTVNEAMSLNLWLRFYLISVRGNKYWILKDSIQISANSIHLCQSPPDFILRTPLLRKANLLNRKRRSPTDDHL